MTKKIIPFEINLKSSRRAGFTFQPRPQILTNDANAAELNFIITDTSSEELTGATATVLLFMKDGSFFQNTDVTRVNNTFVYTIKPNQAKHKGVAQAQLVIKIGTVENASPLMEFEIVGGLETKPIVEREIQDWTSLTAEAKAFVEQIKDFTLEGFVENKMGEELSNLETNYATRLTGLEQKDNQLTAQLAQTEGRLDSIIVDGTPAEGNTMLLDAAIAYDGTNHGTPGTNIRRTQQAIAFPATNKVTNGNFSDGIASWEYRSGNVSVASQNGGLLMTVLAGSINFGCIINRFSIPAKHKHYVRMRVNPNKTGDIFASAELGVAQAEKIGTVSAGTTATISNIVSWAVGSDRMSFGYKDSISGDTLFFEWVFSLNLTETFGEGMEPSVDEIDKVLDSHYGGYFNGKVDPFINQKVLYELVKNDSIPAPTDEIAKNLYDDRYGYKYELNGTLGQNDTGQYPVTIFRDSESFDKDGTSIPSHAPVYEDFKMLGKKGLRIAPDTTNIFSSSNSLQFNTVETKELDAGTYTVSVNGGFGKIVLSGGATGEVYPGHALTFTLNATASVTFTPVNGLPSMSQLEKQIIPTPWQKGGVVRKGDSPRLTLSETPIGEYGIGLQVRFPLPSDVAYQADEYWLLYGYYDANNYFRLIYSTAQQRFSFYQAVNGATTLVQGKQVSFEKYDLLSVYAHVVPGEGIFLYSKKGNVIDVVFAGETGLLPFENGLKHISLGHRLRAESQRGLFANVTIANLNLDIERKPSADNYFKEVL